MIKPPNLLDDRGMSQFIINGYVTVQADFPSGFHEQICRETDAVFEKEGDPGNHILAKVPALEQVFHHPAIHGALTSILGPNYVMQPHRHCHLNPPKSQAQRWHQDGTPQQFHGWNHPWRRHDRVRAVMAFYYSHDVVEEMGATGILPGTQYYSTCPDDHTERALPVCGPAGTVTLVHYELWHRAMVNLTGKRRLMMKFLFSHTQEPQHPHWNASNGVDWLEFPSEVCDHSTVWKHQWRWLSGKVGHTSTRTDNPQRISSLIEKLRQSREPNRLDTIYALGEIGESCVPVLIEALHDESIHRAVAHALSVTGAPAVPRLIEALLSDPDWTVRASAADTLGDIGKAASEAILALINATRDKAEWVRRNAVYALGVIGEQTEDAVPCLIKALEDEHPFIRMNAITALVKIGKSPHQNSQQAVEMAIPAFHLALGDPHEKVTYYAEDALAQMQNCASTVLAPER